MKSKQLMAIGAVVMMWLQGASGQNVTNNYSTSLNQAIPDGDWNGLVSSTVVGAMGGIVTNVSVTLNVSGGFDGDLYAYLVHGTGFAVLMDRVGLSSSNSAGYADAGLTSVLFSDTGSGGDIHFYGGNGGLTLTGSYQPDGRTVNPVTTPAGSFDNAARGAILSSFQGTAPDGTWTLFLADLSGGGQSTLVSWQLQVVAVPEPSVLAIAVLGGALIAGRRSRLIRK